MKLLFHLAVPDVLLILLENKRLMTTELIEKLNIASATFYKQQIVEKLEELNIIKVDTIREGRKETKWLQLTEMGEEIAHKLSLVFNNGKKIVSIPKKKYNELQTFLNKLGEGTVEDFVLNGILEKIKKHKVL